MIINGHLVTLSPLQTWAVVGIIVSLSVLWYQAFNERKGK